ncbi:MAG: hypothetical protein LBQ27_03640, partial [Clostridiales bacterium]|nr:hypothetical protein [Clostridiales bacterium]
MLRVIKYFKKYLKFLIIAVCLICVQAYCDLELPKYISNMINIGIKQGGMEDWLPDVLSQTTFEEIDVFVSAEDYAKLKNKFYTGINEAYGNSWLTEKEYESLKSKYSALDGGEVYVLNGTLKELEAYNGERLTDSDIEELKSILMTPLILYAVFNDVFSVSAVDFLKNGTLLATMWSQYAVDENGEKLKDDAIREYIESRRDYSTRDFFDELRKMSKGEGGLYGESEKKTLMSLISKVINNEFYYNTSSEELDSLRQLLTEAGYTQGEINTVIGYAESGFHGADKEVTDYMFEQGNIQYKIYE